MIEFISSDFDKIATTQTPLAFIIDDSQIFDIIEEKTENLIKKLTEHDSLKDDEWLKIPAPYGLKTPALYLVKPSENGEELGGKLAQIDEEQVDILNGNLDVYKGFALRNYQFQDLKTEKKPLMTARAWAENPETAQSEFAPIAQCISGVHFTRDLVNSPSNIMNTQELANAALSLKELGVEVEILEEADLEKIGMRALLAVGQGSVSPSKVAIMHWKNHDADPLVLVGKGVVFDTGGISIKPAAGMEDMIMDMGGAATVLGTMKALALRQAKTHVIDIIGIVENMPDGQAQRPGDIVKSLKGDTIEVINTDAEGRLVLCDLLWYVQQNLKPQAMIDLATLTGAIIVALGHENTGVFSNNPEFSERFLEACKTQNEGAWAMPLSPAYHKALKSEHADIKNVGDRFGGAITAAAFLQNFVEEDCPWIHLDIAGTAHQSKPNHRAPYGGTGWGVLSLNALIDQNFSG